MNGIVIGDCYQSWNDPEIGRVNALVLEQLSQQREAQAAAWWASLSEKEKESYHQAVQENIKKSRAFSLSDLSKEDEYVEDWSGNEVELEALLEDWEDWSDNEVG